MGEHWVVDPVWGPQPLGGRYRPIRLQQPSSGRALTRLADWIRLRLGARLGRQLKSA